jgi:hypothetical protein
MATIEDVESQWLDTVVLFPKDPYYSDRILGTAEPCRRVYVGMVNRRHRLFLEGDLLLFVTSNGSGRYPVWCRTSRNYSVRGLYLGVSVKPEKNRVTGQLGHFDVVDPEELTGLSPTAPDVRRYVVAYAQARRGQVGAGNLTVVSSVSLGLGGGDR